MSVSAQKVTEKFIVRKIYQSSRFNNKNSFSENNFFSIFQLYVYARAHVRMWTHARPMRTTTLHQYNRTFKNNSYRSFTHFQLNYLLYLFNEVVRAEFLFLFFRDKGNQFFRVIKPLVQVHCTLIQNHKTLKPQIGNLHSPEEAMKAKNTIAKKTCIVIRCNRSRAQEKDVRKKLE